MIRLWLRISNYRWPEQNMPQTDIRSTVDFLCMRADIEMVTVNSTLGKHLINSYDHLSSDPVLHTDHTLISGRDRGKALLIYNKRDRDERQNQYKDTKSVLQDYLQLHVSICYMINFTVPGFL